MGEIAIVALSGGLDSCVTVAIARETYDLALLHISYRQRTEEREKRAFTDIADRYGVAPDRRLVVQAPHFGSVGGSSLTDRSMEVPQDGSIGGRIPSTYVPFRNAFILSVAVSWAEVIGASRVFIGVTERDSSGYPDCRPAFINAFNKLITVATRPETTVVVETPLIEMGKADVVKSGARLGAPLELTWSCYMSSGPMTCGRCESCRLRLKGFKEAGVEDPIPYRSSELDF